MGRVLKPQNIIFFSITKGNKNFNFERTPNLIKHRLDLTDASPLQGDVNRVFLFYGKRF